MYCRLSIAIGPVQHQHGSRWRAEGRRKKAAAKRNSRDGLDALGRVWYSRAMATCDIPIASLRERCEASLRRRGATDEEARVVFDDYLDAELRGRTSHGFAQWRIALAAFPHARSSEVVADKGGIIHIEGHGDCGHVVMRRALDLALPRVARCGIIAIGVSNVTRFGCAGVVARHAAERGAIAIVLEYGGKNLVAPPDGRRAVVATNPIAIGIPGTAPLFVVDIATSERAMGHVLAAKLEGRAVPTTWGIDAAGDPTSDPGAVATLLPFGGHKGFALSLAFEILSGILVGVPVGSKGTLPCRGALVLLLAPNAFGQGTEAFSAAVVEYLAEVQACDPVDPKNPVRYPGVRGEEMYRAASERGVVTLPVSTWEQLSAELQAT